MGAPARRAVGYVAVALVVLGLSVAGLFGGCAAGKGVEDDDDDGASTSTGTSTSSSTTTASSGTGGSAGSGAQIPTGGGGGVVGGGGGVAGTGGVGGSGGSGQGGAGGAPPCGYGSPVCIIQQWDFDNACPSGWTTTGNNSDWGCGAPTSGPLDDCESGGNVWATGLHGLAATCQNSYLESPVVDLSAYQGQTVLLGFYHWYDFRECASNPVWCALVNWLSYSGGRVEVNSGNGWVTVTPQGGYEVGGKTVECEDGSGGSPSCGGAQCDLDGETSAYTCGGVELQWHQALIDVSSHTTNTFQARFVFGNHDIDPILFVNRAGWYIDNVAILMPINCP